MQYFSPPCGRRGDYFTTPVFIPATESDECKANVFVLSAERRVAFQTAPLGLMQSDTWSPAAGDGENVVSAKSGSAARLRRAAEAKKEMCGGCRWFYLFLCLLFLFSPRFSIFHFSSCFPPSFRLARFLKI